MALLALASGVAACQSAPDNASAPQTAPSSATALHCELAAPSTAELAALRATVERGPLFAALAAGRSPTCAASVDGSQWQLDYRFADDTTLRVTRDTAIEYTDYTARVRWPAHRDPLDLLKRAERAAFAPGGCGIDWKTPDETTATTQVWRGDVCNCQARVERDSAGVVALVLRSAC